MGRSCADASQPHDPPPGPRGSIPGRGGVDASAIAATLNLTTVAPITAGFLTIFPCGTQPKASGINYTAGAVVNNEIIAKLSPTGDICIFASAETHLVIDATGWL